MAMSTVDLPARVSCLVIWGRVRLTWSLTPHSPAEGMAHLPAAAEVPGTGVIGTLRPFSVPGRHSADRRAGLTP